MPSTKKLLSILGLKKYFPVSKKGLLQRTSLYVRANEDISIDILEGETFGLVGESGCGKSTLGRTVLQLYEQTAGKTLYYGKTLEEFTPSYVFETLQNAPRLLTRADKAVADTVIAVLGGFAALPDCRPGAAALLKKYETARKRNKTHDPARREALTRELDSLNTQLEALKRPHRDEAQFARYEAMADNGIDLCRLTPSELRLLRKDIQIIFQDPLSALNPRMTVEQLIGEGLITHNFFKPGDPNMREYILQIMEQCGLQGHMLHRYPHQFSGGQRQRICIARALAVKPKFIVCDECVSALDVSIQSQIINLLEELKERENLTYLFISHDLSVVRHVSDRIGVMYLGSIVELGTAQEVFADPRHPYTVALLSAIPSTDMRGPKKERILLEGNIPSPIHPPSGCKFHTRCFIACEKCKTQVPALAEIAPGHFVACHFPERKLDKNGNYLFAPGKSNSEEASHEKTQKN